MAKEKETPIQIPSAKSEDQPATRKALYLVRDELKSDIRSLEHKMDAGFARLGAEMSRMHLLLEEQRSDNRVVLEGLQGLWQRQARIEQGTT